MARLNFMMPPLMATLFMMLALTCLVVTGCDAPQPDQNKPAQNKPNQNKPAQNKLVQNNPVLTETWDALLISGSRVGQVHTVARSIVWQDEAAVRTEAQSSMRLKRFGTESLVHLTSACIETSAEEVLALRYRMDMPGGSRDFEGEVSDDVLRYQVTSAGQTRTHEMPWPRGTGGFFAVEQSLRQNPMTPGETRDLKKLEPMVDQIATWQLVAESWEEVPLLGGRFRLLRIRASQMLPDSNMKIDQTLWTNRDGEVLKAYTSSLDMELIRTTREIATSDHPVPQFDLGLDVVARLEQPLPGGHNTTYAEYELTLESSDPTSVFPSGVSQQVRSAGANTVRLVVHAVRPDQPPAPDQPAIDAPSEPPTEADLGDSSLIQSGDPRIVEMAHSVATDATEPWSVAIALESHVHRVVTKKNFSQVFASAAEVAQHREGDCTEHAVLLAALCRARGIPARVAIGLVYSPPAGGFLYHMWNEVWIADRWVPLDATLGLGGIGAAHLKVTDTNLGGASAYSSLLPILNVVGQLKVKVIEVR